MSHVSYFTELAARFRIIDAQLQVAMRADSSTGEHASLLRRSTDILDLIGAHDPQTDDELSEMLDFFARLRTEDPTTPLDRLSSLASLSRPRAEGPHKRLRSLPDPLPASLQAEDLARLVVRGTGSLLVLGQDKRVLAASAGFAAERRTLATRLFGRHYLEVVGCGRTQVREMQRIERALSGQPQDYSVEVDGIPRPRWMRAIRDAAGRAYAVLVNRTPVPVKAMSKPAEG